MQIAVGDVHLWRIALSDGATQRSDAVLHSFLSGDEQQRAACFRFAHDATRFLRAHGAMREILSFYTKLPAAQLRFTRNHFGKPFLLNNEKDWRFNLSYRGDLALLAVAHQREIGVDIEVVRRNLDVRNLAAIVCCDMEKRELEALSERSRNRAFFHFWTRKEAVLKAMGRGFSFDARQLQIGVHGNRGLVETVCDGENNCWQWRDIGGELSRDSDYVAALALENGALNLRFYDWPTPPKP